MGLDTSHNCWHGPYSSFMTFRKQVAAQIGLNLSDYIGYGEGGTLDEEKIDHPLMPLLAHSDCDGELSVDESKSIVIGLNGVLENFDETIPHSHNLKKQIIQFRDGCLEASEKNEIVDFH